MRQKYAVDNTHFCFGEPLLTQTVRVLNQWEEKVVALCQAKLGFHSSMKPV